MNTEMERPLRPQQVVNGSRAEPEGEAFELTEHRACIRCGYDLYGLSVDGVCPECGGAVAESLRGILLRYASPDYLGAVRRGYSLVLNGILLQMSIVIAQIVGMAAIQAGISMAGWGWLVGAGSLAASVLVFVGYLRLTVPDPQFVGSERPGSSRHIVRAAAFGQIGTTLAQFAILFMGVGAMVGPGLTLVVVLQALALLGYLLWAAQFSAMMVYTRWLAKRVPDAYAARRATIYAWLLPVLATVGALALLLGPLLALVLYWNLLDRVHKHLKAIIATGSPARLKGMPRPET